MGVVANIKGPQGNTGSVGPVQTIQVPFVFPLGTASAAATNLGAGVTNAVSDPSLRRFVDLRGMTKCKIMGRIGGSLVSTTKIRLQYHLGGNIAVATGDAGWTTLAESAASHTVNTMFYTAELTIPAAARIQTALVRATLNGGDAVADPTITACVVDFYP